MLLGRRGAGGLCSVGACAPGRRRVCGATAQRPHGQPRCHGPAQDRVWHSQRGRQNASVCSFLSLTKGLPVDPQSLSTGCVSLSQMKRSNQWVSFLDGTASLFSLFNLFCVVPRSLDFFFSPLLHSNLLRASMRNRSMNMAAVFLAWACCDPFKWLYQEDFAAVQTRMSLRKYLSILHSPHRPAQRGTTMLPYWHCWFWDPTAFV